MITRKYYIFGNSKSGKTTRSDDSGITSTFGTDETCDTGDVSIYSQPYTITKTDDKHQDCEWEKFTKISEIAEMKAGWLKPHKQIKPGNNSKINYNLPRSRIREKKQIFLLKAAA